MARTLRERWRESPGQQSLEQFLHTFGLGFPPVAIVLGFMAWGFPLWELAAGAVAGFWIGGARELVDGWPIESWGDALLDWAFVILGGTLAGLVFALAV